MIAHILPCHIEAILLLYTASILAPTLMVIRSWVCRRLKK